MDRIASMNTKLDTNTNKIPTTNNNTNFLVQTMLDIQDAMLKENGIRDKRMDSIQERMITNNKELKSMREESDKSIKKITKVLTALYNKVSPDLQISFDEWEYHDDATLDEILSMQNTAIRQGEKLED